MREQSAANRKVPAGLADLTNKASNEGPVIRGILPVYNRVYCISFV